MAYRDEGEAMLARARALTVELRAARAEIVKLERKLRGEPDVDESPPAMTATQREITDELANARSLLAGLLEDDPSQLAAPKVLPRELNKQLDKTHSDRDQVIAALQRALLAVLARKLGEVPDAIAAYIETLVSIEGLIRRIADCAAETDEAAVTSAVRRD